MSAIDTMDEKVSNEELFVSGHENTDVGRKGENSVYETQG
jgi:hypothetical protein